MLKTFVKVSTITNLSDARYCAGMGVEQLGFVMDEESVDYVSPEKLKEIKSWLAGVQIVGETESTDYEEIKSMVEQYEIDFLQISDASLILEIKSFDKPIILKLNSNSGFLKENLERYAHEVEYVLLEGDELNEALVHELKEFSYHYTLVLGFRINPGNLHKILENLPNLKGIALKGNHEIRAGFKDYDELMEILEELEAQ
jgi:phosphoribosylanthranilate isomerase